MYTGKEIADAATAIAQLFSGFLTPLIAMFVAYVAWQQHRTARDKLKLDLYDRRFRVYRGLMNLFAAVQTDVKVSREDLAKYYTNTFEKQFLFGSEIIDYMTQVRKNVIALRQLNRKMEMLPKDRQCERDQLIEQETKLLSWFDEQIEQAPQKFEQYLDLKKYP